LEIVIGSVKSVAHPCLRCEVDNDVRILEGNEASDKVSVFDVTLPEAKIGRLFENPQPTPFKRGIVIAIEIVQTHDFVTPT
jgi:hypothetical protein